MDLAKVLADKIGEMEKEGKINDIIGTAVEKLITNMVNDLFASYGDIGAAVRESIKTSIGNGRIDLPEYNAFIAQVVTERYNHALSTVAKEKMQKLIEEEIKPGPERIKSSEIIEEIKERWAVEAEGARTDQIEIDADYNNDTSLRVKIHHPEFDWEDIELVIYDHGKKGEWRIGYIHTNNKCLTSSAINQAGECLSGLPAILFNYWAARTIIDIDEDFETIYLEY